MLEKLKLLWTRDNFDRLLLLLLVAIAGYTFHGVYIFIAGRTNVVLPVAIISFVLSLGLFAFILFWFHKEGKLQVGKIAPLLFLALLVIDIVVVLSAKETFEFNLIGNDGNRYYSIFSINLEDRFRFIFRFFGGVICIYTLVFLVPKVVDLRFFSYVCMLFAGVVTIGLIFSFFKDADAYHRFFTGNFENISEHAVTSFVFHRNTWGLLLAIDCFAWFFLYSFYKKKWMLIVDLIFFAAMIFSISKTALLITIIMYAMFYGYMFVVTYKDHKKRNLIALAILLVLLGAAIGVAIKKNILQKLFNSHGEGFFASFATRTVIWYKVLQVMVSMPISFVFGLGFGISSGIVLSVNNADLSCPGNFNCINVHNMYIQTFSSGGLIKLILFIALLVYIVRLAVQYRKVNKLQSFTLLTGFVAMFIFWIFEG